MNARLFSIGVPAGAAMFGATAIAVWLTVFWVLALPGKPVIPRVAGMDGVPATSADERAAAPPAIPDEPVQGPGVPSTVAAQWPGFRGPQRDGICRDSLPLARNWPSGGPPQRWSVDLGEGYAAAAIAHGCVYVLDYDAAAQRDTLRCLSLDDSREVWHNSYPAVVAKNHGMSRTIPTIAGDFVVTLGPRCHVACWDVRSGQCHWLIDMVRQYGSQERQWYAGQCPLVDKSTQRVILAPCGEDALLVAVDLKSGEELWRSPNPQAWKMTHSSIMPMNVGSGDQGIDTFVYCGTGGTAGVAAEDGRLLWLDPSWKEVFATSPSPLVIDDADGAENRVLLSSGYDQIGATLLQVTQPADRRVNDGPTGPLPMEAISLRTLPRTEFNSEQQTPIYYKGHIYGIRKHRRGQLVCLDVDGNVRWDSGKDRFGHGPYLIADSLIFALGEDGLLVAAEATPEAYRPVARAQVIDDGHEAWGPLAIAAGRLVLRDFTRMICIDLRQGATP